MRVAVMQPYFYPYLLYFQLVTSVDMFVIFDCVQFPRRGRVHRAPLPGDKWLTLPLAQQARETRISDLVFSTGADAAWRARISELPWLSEEVRAGFAAPLPDNVCAYVTDHLARSCQRLGITTPMQRSTALSLDPDLRGQDRVIAAVKTLGGSHYVNLPGGREIYDPETFSASGLSMSFLPPYSGPHLSTLHAFSTIPETDLRAELRALPKPEKVTP